MIKQVKIGPMVYEIQEERNDQMFSMKSDGSGLAVSLSGQFDRTNARIRINVEDAPEHKTVTLWHEIIHGILRQAGQDHTEGLTEALSYGLIALIRDNPDLVDFTRKGQPA